MFKPQINAFLACNLFRLLCFVFNYLYIMCNFLSISHRRLIIVEKFLLIVLMNHCHLLRLRLSVYFIESFCFAISNRNLYINAIKRNYKNILYLLNIRQQNKTKENRANFEGFFFYLFRNFCYYLIRKSSQWGVANGNKRNYYYKRVKKSKWDLTDDCNFYLCHRQSTKWINVK